MVRRQAHGVVSSALGYRKQHLIVTNMCTGTHEREVPRPAKRNNLGRAAQSSRTSSDLRFSEAAAIAQHGMAHDGVVDFLEGDAALAAAQKVAGQKAQKLAKRQRPLKPVSSQLANKKRALQHEATASHGQAVAKPTSKLHVSVSVPKRKRT